MDNAHTLDRGFGTANIPASSYKFEPEDSRLILAHLAISIIALFIGTLAGLLQVLERAGYLALPSWLNYYQILTVHGVHLALIFTTFFIIGFLYSGISKSMGHMPPRSRLYGWIGFYLMLIGTILATWVVLTNDASVLYTFYAPMKANPWFYVGLALLVVGSWVGAISIFSSYMSWRRIHGIEGSSPLFLYMAVATMILWIHASLWVAIEVVLQLIPWSFGWVDRIDVGLSRTLFWYFGHALVYFWLLPAYIYWYVNLPKIVGGKIFSNSLPRLTFLLFILFSLPVGVHHQLNEPGIAPAWKFLQVILTMAVVVPSLLTAFAILATFELAGREKGGKGLFGWLKKLPWSDVRFFTPFIAMVIFIFGGAGGIVLASYQVNTTVHNTWFVTGHFHLTIASTVLLTFFAIGYWLIPLLNGRTLTPAMNWLGKFQAVIWAIGMILMSGTMHVVGVMGAPRRSSYSTYGDHETALIWLNYTKVIAIGGVLLYIGAIIALFIFIYLWFFAPKADKPIEYPVGEVSDHASKPPRILENWKFWIGLSVALSLIAYSFPFIEFFVNPSPGSLPIRSW